LTFRPAVKLPIGFFSSWPAIPVFGTDDAFADGRRQAVGGAQSPWSVRKRMMLTTRTGNVLVAAPLVVVKRQRTRSDLRRETIAICPFATGSGSP
jgi:hypothetical protein